MKEIPADEYEEWRKRHHEARCVPRPRSGDPTDPRWRGCSWCHPGAIRVRSGSVPGAIRVRSGCDLGLFRVRSWCNPGAIRVRSGCDPGLFLVRFEIPIITYVAWGNGGGVNDWQVLSSMVVAVVTTNIVCKEALE